MDHVENTQGLSRGSAGLIKLNLILWHCRRSGGFDSRESLSIDLFAITDSDHKHEQPILMDLVDHSLASDPDPPGGATTQFLRAWWSGVICKLSDCLVEARPLVLIDLGKLLLCRPEDFDRVLHVPLSWSISLMACSSGTDSPASCFATS